MVDRIAVFPSAFETFLESQRRVTHQVREQRRYPDKDAEGGYRFTVTEWEDVVEPTYKEEALPQTLSQEDLKNDRWPAAVYRYVLEDGTVLGSYVVETREYGDENTVLDFMGVRELETNEDRFTWTKDEINNYEETERGMEVAQP